MQFKLCNASLTSKNNQVMKILMHPVKQYKAEDDQNPFLILEIEHLKEWAGSVINSLVAPIKGIQINKLLHIVSINMSVVSNTPTPTPTRT